MGTRTKRGGAEDGRLSELQLAIMRVLWSAPGATVQDVQAQVGDARGLAQSTLATLLSRLEARGLVTRTKQGRQFRYRATVSEENATGSMVDELAQRLFDGDAGALICRLIEGDALDDTDIERVRELIERRRAEGKQPGQKQRKPTEEGGA